MSIEFLLTVAAFGAVVGFVGGAIAYFVAGRQFGKDRGGES